MSAKVSPSRLYTPPRKSIFRNSSIYSKSLMFGKDDPLNSPRYTIFTLPGATKVRPFPTAALALCFIPVWLITDHSLSALFSTPSMPE